MLRKLLILAILCIYVSCREIPSYVKLCKRNDIDLGNCFTNSLYELMPRLLNGGIPEFNIPTIDPLTFSSLRANSGNTGNFDLEFELKQGTASGLRKIKIKDNKMEFHANGLTSTSKLRLPEVNIEADYRAKGRIFLLDVDTSGPGSFNCSELTTDAVWRASIYTKKGKEYLSLDDIQLNNVKISSMEVRLERLLGDNQVLTNSVNEAINENIYTLKDEVEPIIKEVLVGIVKEYFNRVYRRFSIDQLFLTN